jgi:flagellar protein FliO/FliZ
MKLGLGHLAATLAALVTGTAAANAATVAASAASMPSPPVRAFAAPEMAAGPPAAGIGGLTEVTLALAVVLAAIFALAWLVRRLRVVAGRTGPLAVLAEVRLGPKERAVLVKVGGAQLLVGVGQGQINTLHVLPEPLDVAGSGGRDGAERPSFRAALLRSLGKP